MFRLRAISLKRHIVLLALILGASAALSAAPKNKQYRGVLSDQLCGLEHPELMQDARECTLGCVRGGSRYVLANRTEGVVYDLFGKTIPDELAGQQVVITGRWDKRRRAVRVYAIAPDNADNG